MLAGRRQIFECKMFACAADAKRAFLVVIALAYLLLRVTPQRALSGCPSR